MNYLNKYGVFRSIVMSVFLYDWYQEDFTYRNRGDA